MNFSAGNAQSIGARSEQQDSFGFSDPKNRSFVAHGGIAAVVADGMGGLAHGSAASQTAVRAFLDAYQAKGVDEQIPEALVRAIEIANQAVVHLALEADAVNGLGTTLAAAAIHQDCLYWVSAGDSHIYLYRDGNLTLLTVDHVYATDLEYQVAKGEITQTAASSHPERASLTSYLGLEKLPKIENSHQPFPVQCGDYVLICSDGLYRALSEEEIVAALQNDAPKTCEALVQSAIEKGNPAQDNITVLALRCSSDSVQAPGVGGKPMSTTLLFAGLAGILVIAAFLYLARFKPSLAAKKASAQSGNATATNQPAQPIPPTRASSNALNAGSSLGIIASNNSTLTWKFSGEGSVSLDGAPGLNGVKNPSNSFPYDSNKPVTHTFTFRPNTPNAKPMHLTVELTPVGAPPSSPKIAAAPKLHP